MDALSVLLLFVCPPIGVGLRSPPPRLQGPKGPPKVFRRENIHDGRRGNPKESEIIKHSGVSVLVDDTCLQ